MNQKSLDIAVPLVTGRLIGKFNATGQTIEDRDGKPIKVDTDINGRLFSKPKVGPISDLKIGINTIQWSIDKIN